MIKWIHIVFLSVALLLLGTGSLVAQQSGNPFDIESRLDSLSKGENPSVNQDKGAISTNPFEKKKKVIEPETTVVELPQIPTKIRLSTNTWFWILLFVTLLVAIIVNLNRAILSNLMKAWSNVNFSNLLHRDKKGSDRIQYIFLEVVFYINLAITLTLGHQLYSLGETSFITFFASLGAVTAIYLVRHGVLYLLAKAFSITKEALQYSFTINMFNIINGMVLLVFNFFIAFGPDEMAKILLILALGFVGLQLIYRSIRGLLLSARYMINDQVHFFLYLCTCEIMPFVVGAVYISQMN